MITMFHDLSRMRFAIIDTIRFLRPATFFSRDSIFLFFLKKPFQYEILLNTLANKMSTYLLVDLN